MSKEPENKRIKFSDENVDYYERLFMIEHNRAMGYTEREPEAIQRQHMSTQISLVEAANAAFPIPFQLHETFRVWIHRNRMARFDCFEEPNWTCQCYKCETFRAKFNEDLDLQESYMDMYMMDAIRGPSFEEKEPDRKMTVEEAEEFAQTNTSVVIQPNVVCHFFSNLPDYEGTAPSTPKFSTVDYTIPMSDHGKQAAQQRWIRLMQMTPTRLVF